MSTPLTTDAARRGPREPRARHARAIDDAGIRLQELRHQEWEDLALAAVALGLALAATQGARPFALPLLAGGIAVGILGVRALWRRWDLVDRLADQPDAYSIAEVLAYARRVTAIERRRAFAAVIRDRLEPGSGREARLDAVSEDLAMLADALEDRALEISPSCAVACWRLVTDPAQSPLLDPQRPLADLRSAVLRIHAGFTSRASDRAA